MKPVSINRIHLVLVVAAMIIGAGDVFAQSPTESQVKAVFLYNFTHFVEWPTSSYEHASSPFVIGVIGKSDLGRALEETVRGESVKGHPIKVVYFSDLSQLKPCHILYVAASESENLSQIMKRVRKGTLTVSDAPTFHDAGGMIVFLKQDNKIRLAANKAALDSSRLDVSSKLLRLANVKE